MDLVWNNAMEYYPFDHPLHQLASNIKQHAAPILASLSSIHLPDNETSTSVFEPALQKLEYLVSQTDETEEGQTLLMTLVNSLGDDIRELVDAVVKGKGLIWSQKKMISSQDDDAARRPLPVPEPEINGVEHQEIIPQEQPVSPQRDKAAARTRGRPRKTLLEREQLILGLTLDPNAISDTGPPRKRGRPPGTGRNATSQVDSVRNERQPTTNEQLMASYSVPANGQTIVDLIAQPFHLGSPAGAANISDKLATVPTPANTERANRDRKDRPAGQGESKSSANKSKKRKRHEQENPTNNTLTLQGLPLQDQPPKDLQVLPQVSPVVGDLVVLSPLEDKGAQPSSSKSSKKRDRSGKSKSKSRSESFHYESVHYSRHYQVTKNLALRSSKTYNQRITKISILWSQYPNLLKKREVRPAP
jgi:hypothetical protein